MPETKPKSSSLRDAIGYVVIGIFGFMFLLIGCSTLFSKPISPEKMQLAKVTGTLTGYPAINSYGKSQNISILLNEYPNIVFGIVGDAFYASKWGEINDYVFRGDTVYMDVPIDDYQGKIEQQENPNQNSFVAVYSFRTKDRSFLSLADYCKEANSNGWLAVAFLLAGFTILFACNKSIRQLKN